MNLAGKTVLITGGRRVGSELALLLAERGGNVAMTYHASRATIERTIERVRAAGADGLAIEADLAEPARVDRAIAATVERFGTLDVLVNMASTYVRTPFELLQPEDFERMIADNLRAPYLTAVAAARVMLGQAAVDGVRGKIINFGDWSVLRPYKDYLPYLVAKGGLWTMTLALARELAPSIPVNLIAPAMIDPPPEMTPDEIDEIRRSIPLQRIGTARDVNNLVLYLLEGTDFATGTCYRVDGGRFLGME